MADLEPQQSQLQLCCVTSSTTWRPSSRVFCIRFVPLSNIDLLQIGCFSWRLFHGESTRWSTSQSDGKSDCSWSFVRSTNGHPSLRRRFEKVYPKATTRIFSLWHQVLRPSPASIQLSLNRFCQKSSSKTNGGSPGSGTSRDSFDSVGWSPSP